MKRNFLKIFICVLLVFSLTACTTNSNEPDNAEVSKYPNKYIDYDVSAKSETGITWPENQALPSFADPAQTIDAISVSGSNNTMATVAAFCGIINKTKPRVMVYSSEERSEKWYESMGVTLETTRDFESIVEKYKDEIKGLIVWDTKVPSTLNLANSMAGQKDAMIITSKQIDTFTSEPFNFTIIEDLRDRFEGSVDTYTYLYENVWPNCSHRLLAGPQEDSWQLRDLIAGANLACVWLDVKNADEAALLEKFLNDCTPGESYFIGWWSSEGTGIDLAASHGIATIPADYYANYSLYSSGSKEFDVPAVPAKPTLENKIYIAFTLSDGDNIQYVQHTMNTSRLWSSKKRGEVPISWTCAPSLIDAGPQILNHFYLTATENDCIVSGPSGLGYTNPLSWDNEIAGKEALEKYAQRTDAYFRRSGFNVITVWNYISDEQATIYAQNIRSLYGISVQSKMSDQQLPCIVNNTLPIFAPTPRYEKLPTQALGVINNVIKNWDGNSPCFIMPQLVSWDCGVNEIIGLAKDLKDQYGDSVEFVRADHLMMLYSEYSNVPYNITLQSQGINASGNDDGYEAAKAVDGSFSEGKGWQLSGDGEKWLSVDLGSEYSISRYVIKNAGSAYMSKDLNTKGFKIQTSSDGSQWTDIDTVTQNQSNIVDKDVDSFTARYVRLLITDPGTDGIARVQEFELYGVKNS